ncbi:MAG TPA: hypothetical protein VEY95_05580 [Azospirillaceae bacterium]|nr:hypothetical protein [Azospirillaceae bacterium]
MPLGKTGAGRCRRGLAPGFRALHLAREGFEIHRHIGHRHIGGCVDAATGRLFARHVVTLPDGGERFGLHNLDTGFPVQRIRPDTGKAFADVLPQGQVYSA